MVLKKCMIKSVELVNKDLIVVVEREMILKGMKKEHSDIFVFIYCFRFTFR